MLLRSLIYYVFINLWGGIIPIIYCSVFITGSRKWADRGAKTWSKVAFWILYKICKVNYEVRGLENLPKNESFIIACKHQSMWETVVMNLIFKRPAYVFKKELLKIPLYGWYVKRMSGIILDRKGGVRALKDLLSQSKKYLDNNQIVIIFPQGTRVPVGASSKDYPYQVGIAAIYDYTKKIIVPAALNSGVYWNRRRVVKSGTIILEFLPPIMPGLKKKEFLSLLEEKIETRSNSRDMM